MFYLQVDKSFSGPNSKGLMSICASSVAPDWSSDEEEEYLDDDDSDDEAGIEPIEHHLELHRRQQEALLTRPILEEKEGAPLLVLPPAAPLEQGRFSKRLHGHQKQHLLAVRNAVKVISATSHVVGRPYKIKQVEINRCSSKKYSWTVDIVVAPLVD